SCHMCLPGTYKTAIGSADCTSCGINTYSCHWGGMHPAACQQCSANSASPAGSGAITDCTCNTGYTGADGGSCSVCLAGTYKTGTGSAACTSCGVNTYSTAVDGTVCKGCPVGTYKVNTGTGECTECSANTFSATVGASLENTCIGCPTGSSSVARSGVRTNCVCDAGYTGAAGTDCSPCDQGTWKGSTGSGACTLCVQGTYSSHYAAVDVDTCTSCLEFSSSNAGSKSMASCKCMGGYYNTGTAGFAN
ncbi:hypothetical protein T484DRAFT_1647989, partial [Baffinella frigidus]